MIEDVCPNCESRIVRPDGHEATKQLMVTSCLGCNAVIGMTWDGRLYFADISQLAYVFADIADRLDG